MTYILYLLRIFHVEKMHVHKRYRVATAQGQPGICMFLFSRVEKTKGIYLLSCKTIYLTKCLMYRFTLYYVTFCDNMSNCELRNRKNKRMPVWDG